MKEKIKWQSNKNLFILYSEPSICSPLPPPSPIPRRLPRRPTLPPRPLPPLLLLSFLFHHYQSSKQDRNQTKRGKSYLHPPLHHLLPRQIHHSPTNLPLVMPMQIYNRRGLGPNVDNVVVQVCDDRAREGRRVFRGSGRGPGTLLLGVGDAGVEWRGGMASG